MRKAGVLAVLMLAAASLAAYQATPDDRGEAKATIAGKHVAIDYGRPQLKGRDMLGQAKVGDSWRMGSSAATRLTTDSDLTFGTVVVPAGEYILKATRTSAEGWTLNVLKESDKVADVPFTKAALPASVETFTIKIVPDEKDKKSGVLALEWGTTALSAPFRVK